MNEQYISPQLNVICFAPVERLANNEELVDVSLMAEIGTYGAPESGAGFDDGDFGLDIT